MFRGSERKNRATRAVLRYYQVISRQYGRKVLNLKHKKSKRKIKKYGRIR